MGRVLDSRRIAELSEKTQLQVGFLSYDDQDLPFDFQEAKSSLLDSQMIFCRPFNADLTAGYSLVYDVYGSPALILKVSIPRSIYNQGLVTVTFYIITAILLSMSFVAASMLLMERDVISPLAKLNDEVISVSRSDTVSKRLTQRESGKRGSDIDELTTLARSINSMLEKIEDTTTRLNKAQRLAAIGELAAMVGHDLRNPLTSIGGAAYYLKANCSSIKNSKEREMLTIIESAIDHSNRIINDLLDYSGEIRLELTKTTPKSLVEEALSQLVVPTNIEIRDQTSREPSMEVDEEKIQRVFINIIKNAIDAMPDGGILTVECQNAGNDVVFCIRDTGPGMSEDTLQRIFTPLFTTKAKGMGLGLAICRRIIEAHRGKITVDSVVGKGSVFTLSLPLEPQPKQNGPKTHASSAALINEANAARSEPR